MYQNIETCPLLENSRNVKTITLYTQCYTSGVLITYKQRPYLHQPSASMPTYFIFYHNVRICHIHVYAHVHYSNKGPWGAMHSAEYLQNQTWERYSHGDHSLKVSWKKKKGTGRLFKKSWLRADRQKDTAFFNSVCRGKDISVKIHTLHKLSYQYHLF